MGASIEKHKASTQRKYFQSLYMHTQPLAFTGELTTNSASDTPNEFYLAPSRCGLTALPTMQKSKSDSTEPPSSLRCDVAWAAPQAPFLWSSRRPTPDGAWPLKPPGELMFSGVTCIPELRSNALRPSLSWISQKSRTQLATKRSCELSWLHIVQCLSLTSIHDICQRAVN